MRRAAMLVAVLWGNSLYAGYQYYGSALPFYSGSWAINGSFGACYVCPPVWGSGFVFPAYGSIISTVSVPDGTADYEVRTMNQLTQVLNSNFVLYLRASSDALHSESVTQGSYYAVVMTPNYSSGGVQTAALTVYKRVSGTVTQLATTVVPWRANTELRAVAAGSNLLLYVSGERYLTLQDTDLTTGKPGFGGYSFVGYNGVYEVQLGPLDRNAPSTPNAQSAYTTALSNTVDLQWGGVSDDANGVGVYSYQISRDGNYLAEVYGTGYSDTTVSPSSSYSYAVKALDRHGNVSGAMPLAVMTAPPGSIEPRRVGVRSDGSYYGGAGEQLDMRSGNLNYSIPLISAQGRGGVGLSLGLSYNSQNWRKDTTTWRFGRDIGYGFGWRLGAGSLTPVYTNALSVHHYLFTDASGAEYRLNVNTSGVWTSTEGTYLTYVEASNRLYFNSGSYWQMDCMSGGTEDDAGARYPTRIEDSNGNYIVLRYQPGIEAIYATSSGRISEIEDVRVGTGAATYTFTYNTDTTPHLTGITNSINTAENYAFTYSTAVPLYSPFTGGASFGNAQMLLSVTQTGTSLSHTFEYGGNAAGELTKVIMPYAGELRWTHSDFMFSGSRVVREVTQRQLVMQSGATPLTYPISHPSGDSSYSSRSQATLADASGIGDRVWTFVTAAGATNGLVSDYQQRDSGAVTKRKQDYTWTADPWGRLYIGTVLTTLDPGQTYQKQSKTEQTLDAYGNVSQRKEYAFNSLTTPAKTYTNTYLSTSSYVNAYIRNRLVSSQVTDGANTVTLASNQYDNAAPDALATTPGQFDSTNYGYFSYNRTRGNATTTTVPGKTRQYVYDVTGTISRVTDELGRYVQLTNGQATDYTRPTAVTPNGDSTLTDSLTWNGFLGLTQDVGPHGETGSVAYDSNARPTSVTSPQGAVTTYTYANSPPTVTATTNGHWVKTTMDGFGRTVKTERGDNVTRSVVDVEYAACACSPLGKVKRVSQPHTPGGTVYWTTYTYDGLGRTVSVLLPNGTGTSTYAYSGNSVTTTDPAGIWRAYENDAFGNVTKTIEPNPAGGSNLETTYSYNVTGQMILLTMTRGSVTQNRSWNYDATTLRLSSETHPESGTTYYSYNGAGQLSQKSLANGKSVSYSYDGYGRMSQMTDSADPCSTAVYSYGVSDTEAGRMTEVKWGNGVGSGCNTGLKFGEGYKYTPTGLIATKTTFFESGSPRQNAVIHHSYDNEGRMTFLSDVNSQTTGFTYFYDGQGRPTDMFAGSFAWVNGVAYNAAGQMTSISFPQSGYSESRQYNERNQLTRITVSGQMDLEYRYSATQNNGKITSMKNWINGEEVNYVYDSLGRLSTAVTTGPEWGLSFTYDGFGNKTAQSVTKGSAPAMSVAVDSANHIVGQSYDGAGNTTAANGVTMTWDGMGRMTSAAVGGGSTDIYSYSPKNRRVFKTQSPLSSQTGSFIIRGLDGNVREVWQVTSGVATGILPGGNIRFAGRKVGVKEDRLGTVQNGSRYFPYGEESPATAQNTDKFATYYRDSGTGFDYAVNRYYMPVLGRFLSTDKYSGSGIALRSGSWNKYAYTEGDPSNGVDPFGNVTLAEMISDEQEAGVYEDPNPNLNADRELGPSTDIMGDREIGNWSLTYQGRFGEQPARPAIGSVVGVNLPYSSQMAFGSLDASVDQQLAMRRIAADQQQITIGPFTIPRAYCQYWSIANTGLTFLGGAIITVGGVINLFPTPPTQIDAKLLIASGGVIVAGAQLSDFIRKTKCEGSPTPNMPAPEGVIHEE